MRTWILVLGLLSLSLAGCEDRRQKAVQKVDDDTAALARVNGVVNEVLRNSTDCSVAKPMLSEAYQRIDAARGQIKLESSRQALDMQKAQVDRVSQACQ